MEVMEAIELSPFQNEPFTDFSRPENIAAMQAALNQVHNELGKTWPLIIGGEAIYTVDTFASTNPAHFEEVIGYAGIASREQAIAAIDNAVAAFPAWRKVSAHERAELLVRVADEIRQRKFEFMAWLAHEVSKTWAEADAEVAEAIDFCEFYAREALRLSHPQPVLDWPGEHNESLYIPLGTGVSIPPWNFSLAIMAGLTVAPIVCGNTTVLKPSPRSPVVAAKFMEILEKCGLPSGVVNFITGRDEEIGDVLVDHPDVKFIAFTGSKAVGLRISERAAKRQPGQNSLKRAILEMGGKDTVIVDETADLEAAATVIANSAFGYGGQKCSACSRVVAIESVHDELLEKVVARAKEVKVGNPSEQNVSMGALIDGRALDKVREYLVIGQKEARVALLGATQSDTGYFAWPTLFTDVAPDAHVAQEEIFGPVIAFIKARDFDEALDIANNTEYGLTGGVFTRDDDNWLRAREEFHVGNLYRNRKITGALVGVQPFGGFKMSGTDSKAGGHDYLLLFLQLKSITEKL